MLRERYEAENIFERVQVVGLAMEPVLTNLDKVLDEDGVFQGVKTDLGRRYPQTLRRGRWSTPVEVVLRMLIVKHLYGWSYEQTEQWVNDSLVLRQFCRVYLEKVPDDTTLIRWANQIQPATLDAVLEQVMRLATQLKVTKGRKLRVDSTVVETDVHHPVDSTLLGDGVRVIHRLLDKARRVGRGQLGLKKKIVQQQGSAVRERVLQIMQAARQRGETAADQMRTAYQDLVQLSQQVVDQALTVSQQLHQQATPTAQTLAHQLDTFVPRLQQVIRQTTRRVLADQPVPASEKIVSLFEPHTAIIRKGKAGKPVEFGRVVWLDEVDGGLISRAQVLSGNPPDADQLVPSLQHHQALFNHPPHLLAGDRKVFSPKGEAYALDRGVSYVVLPKPGAKSQARQTYENQPWFRSGRNWRSGLEGRISLLKRRFGLRRCRYHGDAGMQRCVSWGVIAYDLVTIARQLAR